MPGIDTGAPERTETSSGSLSVAEAFFRDFLEAAERCFDFAAERVGNLPLAEVLDAERAGEA